MSEQLTPVKEQGQTPAAPPAAPPVPPSGGPSGKKKKKKRSVVKTVIALVLVVAILGGIGFGMYKLVFEEDKSLGEPMVDWVQRGSIQSMVQGSGLTRAKDSATITPGTGTLLELYVSEGDQVEEGQPLYVMDDSIAQEAIRTAQEGVTTAQEGVVSAQEGVSDAQKNVNDALKALEKVEETRADLTITAPHAGKLMEVSDLKVGDTVDSGTKVAVLVNDTKLRLSLYYNYTYENDVYVGQPVTVSIPAIMGERPGTVEAVNKVRFISPEGGIYFEVVVVLDNPGTLTEGMDASAGIVAGGVAVYPYENGQLKYYETTDITAKARGPVEQANLLNYADVAEGQVLVQLGDDDLQDELDTRREAVKSAQERLTDQVKMVEEASKRVDEANKKVEEAVKELEKYSAVAPISGTVLSCNLVAGTEVQSGQGITIADTSRMTIDINVDERNIASVKVGMMVDINYQGQYFMGIVESVSLTGTAENGMSVFPAVVSVDNPDGLIMSNSYADYSFVASESDNCLVVPVNAVKYVSFANVPGIEDLIASGPTGDDSNGIGGMDGMGEMDGSFPQGGEPMPGGGDMTLPEGGDQPVDGDMTLPEGGDQPVDGDTLPDDGGEPMDDSGEPATDGNAVTLPADGGDVAIPVPEQYTSGVFAQPLREVFVGGNGEVVTIVGGGSSSSSGGSSSSVGGSSSGSAISDDGTGYIVFVRAPEAPENAILEPDPAWECPEGFWAVPVVTGLSNTTQVEIISGLNEGDEIFIGYASNSGGSWG